jgi:hypothetical protein
MFAVSEWLIYGAGRVIKSREKGIYAYSVLRATRSTYSVLNCHRAAVVDCFHGARVVVIWLAIRKL